MSDPASSRSRPARSGSARERLLAAAEQRFYADGVSTTGIDTITAEAGVAKMSLYNNFASKAELVRAYLERRHEVWLEAYQRCLEDAHGPRDGALAVFDAYAEHADHASEYDFRGCGLLNAAAELPTGDRGRDAVRRHKEEVEALLIGHLEALLPDRPAEARPTAEHLAYLLEGAVARAGLEGDAARLRRARELAEDLLDAL